MAPVHIFVSGTIMDMVSMARVIDVIITNIMADIIDFHGRTLVKAIVSHV